MITVQNDFSLLLGPVRDQGDRGTCLACSASDVNALSNTTSPLSVDFLCHHAAKAMSGWVPGNGFTVNAIVAAAVAPGQCSESLYPYQPQNEAAPLATPPAGLAPLYQSRQPVTQLKAGDVLTHVQINRAVIVAMAVPNSLYYPQAGIVAFDPMKLPNEFHAMVAVGIGVHTVTNETHFLLRNSWGTAWGVGGHAWVPYSLVDLHLIEGLVL